MKYSEILQNCKDNFEEIKELFEKTVDLAEYNEFDENKNKLYWQFIELFEKLNQYDRIALKEYMK